MERLTYNCAIVTAAGSGTRLQGEIKKQFRVLAGIPVLIRTLSSFILSPLIDSIVITAPEEDISLCREMIDQYYQNEKPIRIISGGFERQDSIFGALQNCPHDTDYVFIHDAVRPFISTDLIQALYDEVVRQKAVIPVATVKHTIKRVFGDVVLETLDRNELVQVYTPQVFAYATLMEAYMKAYEDGFVGTDDAVILEHSGVPVHTLITDDLNIKITDSSDWLIAEALLDSKKL